MSIRIDEKKILKEIIELLERRSKIKSLTEYYYSTMDLCNLIHIYQKLTGEILKITIPNNGKLANRMYKYMGMVDSNLYFYFLNQSEHTELSKNVLEVFDKEEFISHGRKDANKLSEKEFFEIERDFLGTYDERMLKLFDSAINRGLLDMRGVDKSTATTFMKMTNDNHYVLLPNDYNIEGLIIISHELGHLQSHSVLDVRSKRQLNDTVATYYEAYSHYMEQCLFEYLKQNHIYLKDTIVDENNYYAWMKDFFDELNLCSHFNPKEQEEDVIMMISEAYQYSYGMLIGVLLHERYKENPFETKKDIDNFLFNQGLVDNEGQLEMLGFSRCELNESKVLSKRLHNHKEDFKKYC